MNLDSLIISVIKNIDFNSIDYYKLRAFTDIRNYLNKNLEDEVIEQKFKVAIVELIKYYLEVEKQGNITSMSQGQRSVSYAEVTSMPKHIKNLLPRPCVTFRRG